MKFDLIYKLFPYVNWLRLDSLAPFCARDLGAYFKQPLFFNMATSALFIN